MGIFDRFPYSSTHEMNLDFMLGKATEIAESLQEVQDGLSDIDTHKAQAEQAAQDAAQAKQAAQSAAQTASTSAGQAAQHKTDAEDAADRAEAASNLADDAVEQAQTAAQNASTAADGAIASATAAENRINAAAAQAQTDVQAAATQAQTNVQAAATQAQTNVQTAADSAVASAAAAENRINALAESLPEDFTDLNNEVTDLKSALNALDGDIYPIVTKTLGYNDITWNDSYISTDGSLVSHAAYKTSPYMEVAEGDIVVYDGLRAISSSYFSIGAYDSTKSFINASSLKGTGSAQTGTYTVPQGVSYIILCTYNYYEENDFESVTMPVKTNVIEQLTDITEEHDSRLTAVEDEVTGYHYTETGFSYFDFEETGTLDYSDGTEKSYEYCKRTDYISTDGMLSITASIKGLNRWNACIACYDASKNYLANKSIRPDVAGESSATIQVAEGTITITNDIKYIRVSIFDNANHDDDTISITKTRNIREDYTAEKEKVDAIEDQVNEIKESVWKGKKWYAFGTSLTDNTYLDPNNDPTGKYPQILNQWMQANLVNKGKGGGGITSHSNGAILTAIQNTDFSDADLVTLEGFPNDYSAAPGTFTDTTTDTLCGALYVALSAIYTTAPNATVVLITASQGQLNQQGTAGYPIDFVSATGNYQVQYNEAIIKMGQYFGCHVIDAGGKAQINNFHPDYLVDHIHHSWAGGWQYAATIWEELKQIHPNTNNPYLTE